MQLNTFADDYEIHKNSKPMQNNLGEMLATLESITLSFHNWMNENRLKMNPDKTEFMLLHPDDSSESKCDFGEIRKYV